MGKIRAILLGILGLLLLPLALAAQTPYAPVYNGLKGKQMVVSSAWQVLDSLTILPESVRLYQLPNRQAIPKENYEIRQDSLRFLDGQRTAWRDSVWVEYRILPYDLRTPLTRFDSTQVIFDASGNIVDFNYDPYAEETTVIDFKGLDYRGNFARGISFGNSQNLVVNSNFNLQMAGEIGDGIEVLAAITDENIPLQAEGNTQQLNEFDKIFIQLKKNKHSLTAGDYELRRPNGYFMNYFKKLQGATYSNSLALMDKKGTLENSASMAITRGKFARNTLPIIEGNQGPYKLQGADNERFIIILSGTEKVFWDGELLVRGLENDYTINYNRGDITFTPKRLITKDIRIIVEFEYSTQSYLRSLVAANTTYTQGKFRAYINAYSEQDGKSSTSGTDLDSLEINALRASGDGNEPIFLDPAITKLEQYDEFRVLYELRDTNVLCGGGVFPDSVLVASSNPVLALYAATFVEVGFGNGNYILCDTCAANGRVYTWLAPNENCISQGNYRPARRLVPPEQRQLFTAGVEYQISKKSSFRTEVALSNNDPNRFSNEQGDNQGIAVFSGWEQRFDLGSDTSAWALKTKVNYEFVQARFQALNPYRVAEFTRDWNLGIAPTLTTEHIGTAGVELSKQKWGSLAYNFSGFVRQNEYEGQKQSARLRGKRNGWEVDVQSNLLNTNARTEQTTFFRPKGTISKTFEQLNDWKTGVYGEREHNERYAKDALGSLADTLNRQSFSYNRWRAFLESPANEKFQIGLSYSERIDYAPVENRFEKSTEAEEISLNGHWKQARTSRLSWSFIYRELSIRDSTLSMQQPAETWLGRSDYNWSAAKGVFRSNTGYEISSGQEQKVEFQYLEVPAGEGVYQWRDYNTDDNVQLNELELAVFQDSANAIRIPLYTDEFIRVNKVQFNQSLRIDPRAIWFNEKGFKNVASKFSTQSTLQITRKVRVGEDINPWNPFQLDIVDTSLVATRANVSNRLYFNRGNQQFEMQLGQTDVREKTVLTSGYESRRVLTNLLNMRWNITKTISLQTEGSQGVRQADSEFFNDKDYYIPTVSASPKLTWQPNRTFRTIVAYKWSNSENTLPEGGETALMNDLNAEIKYTQSGKMTVRAKLSYVQVDFVGSTNSPVGFALLQGLQDGQNFLWNINFDRQLSKNLRMNLSYEGRKTGAANVVHVGRASVAATF